MKRTIFAVLGLGAAVSLGGVAYAGYTVYQTTEHAMAAVSSFKNHIPKLKPPTSQFPAGLKPPTGRQGIRQPVLFPALPTPGTSTAPRHGTTWTRPYQYPYGLPTPRRGRTHPYPYYRPAPQYGSYHPRRP